jgi:hypothetical protein
MRFLALFLGILAAADASADDWPTPAHDNRRTGFNAETVAPPFKEAWRHDFGEMIDPRVQPVVSDGVVVVATYKGRVHALDAATGKPKWSFETRGPIFHSPSIFGGRVFAASHDRFVYALYLADGREIWRFETGEGVHASPMVEESTVLVGSRDGVFYALDAGTGKEAWRFKTGGPILTTAAADGELVHFASEDLTAYALQRRDGELRWKAKLAGQSVRSYWPAVSGLFVYYRTLPVRSFWQHACNEKADAQNPDRAARVAELLKQDPASRTFFALDRKDGSETVFPVLWTAGGGTVPYPPVVLPGDRIATPAPAGEKTRSSGATSLSIIDENNRKVRDGWMRVIGDESYGFSAAGPWIYASHHDYLWGVDTRLDPDLEKNPVRILGHRDRPVDARSGQGFGNHDNHPGWHAASVARGHLYWITQGSWLFALKGGSR